MRLDTTPMARPVVARALTTALLGAALLTMTGCQEPEDGSAENISAISLTADTLLNLSCADAGIYLETCVLDDPENPFTTAVIVEFDVNNAEAFNKFELANAIPAGADGAKSRFYFWATALARRPSGENQWYTARALHELFDLNEDPIVQAQALRAYRSVLDNFFGAVTFFECCAGLDPNNTDPVAFSVPLNELVADNLYRTASTGCR